MIASDVWFVPGFFSVCSELELPYQSYLSQDLRSVLKMIRVSDFVSEASVLLEFKGLFLQMQDKEKNQFRSALGSKDSFEARLERFT